MKAGIKKEVIHRISETHDEYTFESGMVAAFYYYSADSVSQVDLGRSG